MHSHIRLVLVQLNLALVGLLNVSLALEDPFDNQGLDGIYVDEALFEAEQVLPPCCLSDLYRGLRVFLMTLKGILAVVTIVMTTGTFSCSDPFVGLEISVAISNSAPGDLGQGPVSSMDANISTQHFGLH